MTIPTDLLNELPRLFERRQDSELVALCSQVLREIERDPGAITARLQPLGFVHAELLKSNEGTFRLHLWPQPPVRPQSPAWHVHRHPWPLRSYVIRGAVRNSEYQVQPVARSSRRLYDVGYEGGISRLTATHQAVGCTCVKEETYDAGTTYEVPVDTFHATSGCASQPAATLAVVGPSESRRPLVVGEFAGRETYEFVRAEVSAVELSAILADIGI